LYISRSNSVSSPAIVIHRCKTISGTVIRRRGSVHSSRRIRSSHSAQAPSEINQDIFWLRTISTSTQCNVTSKEALLVAPKTMTKICLIMFLITNFQYNLVIEKASCQLKILSNNSQKIVCIAQHNLT